MSQFAKQAGIDFSNFIRSTGLQVFFGLGKTLTGIAIDWFAVASTPPFVSPLGIVRGVGDRHASQNVISPPQELLPKIRDLALSFFGQVLFFAQILRDMVQFDVSCAIEVFDELPIAFPDGAGGPVVVIMGIVPMDRLAVKLGLRVA